jgi:hypothetical protein
MCKERVGMVENRNPEGKGHKTTIMYRESGR